MQSKISRRLYKLHTCGNMYSYAREWICQYIYEYVGMFSCGHQGQKCTQELDRVQIHVYFRSKYTLTETSMSGKLCLKYPSKVCKMKRKEIFVPTQQVEPSLQTASLEEAPQFATPKMKYALELQGYGAPNGHTDTSAVRLVLSAQPTQLRLDEPHSRAKLFMGNLS